jgi:hypothetical protein
MWNLKTTFMYATHCNQSLSLAMTQIDFEWFQDGGAYLYVCPLFWCLLYVICQCVKHLKLFFSHILMNWKNKPVSQLITI